MKCFQEVGVIFDKTGKTYKIQLEIAICDAPGRHLLSALKHIMDTIVVNDVFNMASGVKK